MAGKNKGFGKGKSITQSLIDYATRHGIHSRFYWYSAYTLGLISSLRNWPSALLWKLGRAKRPFVAKLRNGLKYNVSGKADLSIIVEVFCMGAYNLDSLGIDIRDGDVIVDIGAQKGTFTLLAASRNRNAKTYSYEPQEGNYKMLAKNIKGNNLRNSKAFNLAVSDHDGEIAFYESSINNGGHSAFEYEGNMRKTISPCITLSAVFRENSISHCRLLKLDCEGSEYNILFSAPREILMGTDYIIMEIHEGMHEGHTAKEMKKFLESNNFNVRKQENMLYAKRKTTG